MEVIIDKKDIKKMIKDYYKKVYSVKNCKVSMKAENIKNKLEEIDLFHADSVYYNVLFRTTISGMIPDNQGELYSFYETINERGVKDIIHANLDEHFDVESIKLGFNFDEDRNADGMGVEFMNALVKVDKKHAKTK